MNTRVNVILNGKRDLAKVLENLKPIVQSDDRILLYTKSEVGEVKKCFADVIGIAEDDFNEQCSYVKFNQYKKENYTDDKCKRISVMKMPNLLFDSISAALNSVLDFCDDVEIARFVHFFYDDVKLVDEKRYSPSKYEWYMDEFSEPFIIDAKLNKANFAFKKLSPRFIFLSSKIESPVSFYQFDGKDHFIIDRVNNHLRFDEGVKRLYMIEYIIRAHEAKIVKHFTFYPDPTLEMYFKRDESMPQMTATNELMEEYRHDDDYIRNTLKKFVTPESSVDPIISEMGGVIKAKSGGAETVAKVNDTVTVTEVVDDSK